MHKNQEVICVDASSPPSRHLSPPLVKDQTYQVQDVSCCSNCKTETIDIGIESASPFSTCKCGHSQPNHGIWWVRSERFVPVDYTQAKQISFKEIKEPIYAN